MNVRLKAVAEVHAGLSPPSNDVNTDGIGTPFLQGNAEFGSEIPTPQYWTTSPRRVSQDGDILISVRAPVGAINRSDQRYALGRGIAAVRPKSVNPRFLWWAAGLIAEQLRATARGSTYEAVVGSDVENTRLDLPDPLTQALIADFLDRETHRIDALVDAKRRIIDLLEEKRSTSILTAVTGADSGTSGNRQSPPYSWLAPVPEDWSIHKISHAFRTGSGTTPRSDNEDYYDGPHAWVMSGDLNDGRVLETRRSLTDLALTDYSALKIYPPDSLVIAMYGATIGKLGILGLPAAVNQACCVLQPNGSLSTKFAFYWLLAHRDDIITFASGGGQPNISQEKVASLRIPAPDETTQRVIVRDLERQLETISALIDRLRVQLDFLSEYRQALVTQAVTGQLDEATLKGDKPVDEAVGVIPE